MCQLSLWSDGSKGNQKQKMSNIETVAKCGQIAHNNSTFSHNNIPSQVVLWRKVGTFCLGCLLFQRPSLVLGKDSKLWNRWKSHRKTLMPCGSFWENQAGLRTSSSRQSSSSLSLSVSFNIEKSLNLNLPAMQSVRRYLLQSSRIFLLLHTGRKDNVANTTTPSEALNHLMNIYLCNWQEKNFNTTYTKNIYGICHFCSYTGNISYTSLYNISTCIIYHL